MSGSRETAINFPNRKVPSRPHETWRWIYACEKSSFPLRGGGRVLLSDGVPGIRTKTSQNYSRGSHSNGAPPQPHVAGCADHDPTKPGGRDHGEPAAEPQPLL